MRLVHLSDLHLGSIMEIDTKRLMNALIEDLLGFHQSKKIDLLFITGDLIDKGGSNFKEGGIKEAFIEFEKLVLNPLIESFKITKEQIIFIPGNHDIDRNADSKEIQSGLKTELNGDIKKANYKIDNNNYEGIKRVFTFKDFESNFHKDYKGYCCITKFHSHYILEVDGVKVGINALNTAWRCYDDDDYNYIILGERQISSFEKLKECNLRIALMHHSPDFLPDFERESIVDELQGDYDILLCGHIHKGKNYSKTTVNGSLFTSIVPINSAQNMWSTDKEYENGYSIIDSYEDKIIVYNRSYVGIGKGFNLNPKLSEKDSLYGAVEYPSKRKSRIKSKQNVFISEGNDEFMFITNKNETFDSHNINSTSEDKEIYVRDNEKYYRIMRNKSIITKQLQSISSHSQLYNNIEKNINKMFTIVDRILCLFNESNNYITYVSYFERLVDYISAIQKSNELTYENAKEMVSVVEWWLSQIYKYINNNNETDELDKIIEELLSLLFKEKIVEDEAVNLFKEIPSTIKILKSGDQYNIKKIASFNFINQMLMGIILPVFLNAEKLVTKAREKNIGEIENEDRLIQVTNIKNEYLRYAENFIGRQEEINNLIKDILEYRYVFLRGESGTGKTYLVAKSFYEMSKNIVGYQFSNTMVLFSFKHSLNIHDMVMLLIEQCNNKIVNKVDISILERLGQDKIIHSNDDYEKLSRFDSEKYKIYKKYLQEIIKRVINECGELILLIDSINLVREKVNIIQELVVELPNNVHIIFVTDEVIDENNIITTTYPDLCKTISANTINRENICIYSGMNDDLDESRSINDELYQKSKGYINKIINIIDSIKDESGKLDINKINDYVYMHNDLFERNADKWLDSGQLTEEILLFLSITYPISAVSFENLQLFLKFRNYSCSLPRLRIKLRTFEDQVKFIRNSRIQFYNSEYATYIIKKYFGKQDIFDFINILFNWIVSDNKPNIEFVTNLILILTNEFALKGSLDKIIENFIETYKNNKEAEILFKLGKHLYFYLEIDEEISCKFLEASISLNNIEAKTLLGYAYITGNKIIKDELKGTLLLEEASNAGNARAKRMLGNTLMNDPLDINNQEKGRRLLEEAITLGEIEAKYDLAIKLLLGVGTEPNINMAEILLIDLVEAVNINAIRILGRLYLSNTDQNKWEKGLQLLNQAVELGSKKAKLYLAIYYINDISLSGNKELGLKYITQLIEEGNRDAKKFYANYLLESKEEEQSIELGIKMLKDLTLSGDDEAKVDYAEAIIESNTKYTDKQIAIDILEKESNNNNIYALDYYGSLFIDGKMVEKNIDKGIRLIEEAINKDNDKACFGLALRYIYGNGLNIDLIKAKELLKKPTLRGHANAKSLYAQLLLKADKIADYELKEARELLEIASTLGSRDAQTYLGIELIEGHVFENDVSRGLTLLDRAVKLGSVDATRNLGRILVTGSDSYKDITKGVSLLEKGIKDGDVLSQTILGHVTIIGYIPKYSTDFGVSLLEKAAKSELNAKRILGDMLIRGHIIPQDKVKGRYLLEEAAKEGDNFAQLILAGMLIDGNFIEKDRELGKKYLYESANNNFDKACLVLGNRLIDGDGLDKDIDKGMQLLEKLINKGDQEAKCDMGYRLIMGEHIAKNVGKGKVLLRELSSKQYLRAMRILSDLIMDKKVNETEKDEGVKLLECAVEKKDAIAMKILGNRFIDGDKIEKDSVRGESLLHQAIEQGNEEAMHGLAIRLIEGYNINKNVEEGIKLLKKSIELGNQKSKHVYAVFLIDGEIVEQDTSLGLQMLNELIDDGFKSAKNSLAFKLVLGDRVDRNLDEGIKLYESLVKEEYIYAIRQYAQLLIDGVYIKKDINMGECLLKSAVQKGDSESTYMLSRRYLNGNGLKKRVKHGKERLIKAVDNGNNRALLEYGIRILKGDKFSRDENCGKKYIKQAIDEAESDELVDLGVIAYELKEFEIATEIFYKAYLINADGAANSLAYMKRRNEIKGVYSLPEIAVILKNDIENNRPNAIVNYALSMISSKPSAGKWECADKYMRKLNRCVDYLSWWHKISLNGDAEGDLVLGWVVMHKLMEDPDNIPYKSRLLKAKKGGWKVPEWMLNFGNLLEDTTKEIAITENID